MLIVELLFWFLLALVIYVYAGYPAFLWILTYLTGGRPVDTGPVEPAVTLIISAYNEAEVIARKIRNSLAIDYPRHLLELLVVSDASDDGTDDIVGQFESDGVVLVRMEQRGGKTTGLNEAVKRARGEIVVFSDANAMYRTESLRAMLKNFHDPAVGCVVGESTYESSSAGADKSESAYWRYETALKRLESKLGSVVGGDGAIYAIRKELYRPMNADALSDFVNPCQIVEMGKRCVYEPAAVSVEAAAGTYDKEFRRKVRIVNRAWRATIANRRLLNPFRFGLFSLGLFSHKFLRWIVPFLLAVVFCANLILAPAHVLYKVTLGLQLAFYGLALTGRLLRRSGELPVVLYVPYYFCLVNFASACGIWESYRGKTYTTWSTARTD